MIVILIISILAAVGVPRFLRSPQRSIDTFIAQLNNLVSQTTVEAQRLNEPLRIFFSLSGKRISAQTASGKLVGGTLTIPDSIEISDVVINGKSQFAAGAGEKDFVYFLINQDGISQEVQLIVKDRAVAERGRGPGLYEFYLNPFTSVFRLR